MANGTSGYDAFISYSHVLDGALARALQTGLEQFAKPWYRPRALRVFRDTTSLSANPGLWSSIETALASSDWLVLMASPKAARSPWVDREVAWWLENKSPQRLLVVLTEGEFAWDDNGVQGDGASTVLPPTLRGVFVEEPRWVDLRWLRDVDQVAQSNPWLRECVADVAAAVREVAKDELVGEHIRQHRRTVRLARGGVTALAVLLIAALVAAVVAVGQRNQTVVAQHTAIARGMVAQAEGMRDRNPRGTLQFGVAAHQLDPSPLTQASLMQTLMSSRYRSTLTGHTGGVYSVAFSPDGHTLATASDRTVILWDLTDRSKPRQLGQPLPTHTSRVPAVAFSPDGHTLATSGFDQTPTKTPGDQPAGARTYTTIDTVILWDLSDRSQPRQLGQPLPVNTLLGPPVVAFSPDGHTLAIAGDRTVILWDLRDRSQPDRLGQPPTAHTSAVQAVAFSPDGRTLATASNDQTVILWDLTDRAQPRQLGQPLTGHTSPVSSVVFSPDGQTLATASLDHTVILWDFSDRIQPRQLDRSLAAHTIGVSAVAFSPDGHTLATASLDHTVILWDLSDRAQPRQLGQPLTAHTSPVSSVVFSPDGQTLATAGDLTDFTAGRAPTVILWDLSDRAQPRQLGQPLTGHTRGVSAVAFSPDGHTLATASLDRTVILWDLSDRAQPRQLGQPLTAHTSPMSSVAFSPDGHTLATASGDRTVILWDLSDRSQPRQLGQPLTTPAQVSAVAFSPDGHTLATASFDKTVVNTVILWDVSDRAQPRQLGQPLTGHTSGVRAVAFSPDGHTLATASADQTVILWDLSDRAQPRQLGQRLTGHTNAVLAVAFSSNGPTLATTSIDQTVILWDLTDRTQPRRLGQPLTGHTNAVLAVAFSPDGHTLATASGDQTASLWDLTPLEKLRRNAVREACVRAGESLDETTWSFYAPNVSYQDTCASR